MMYFFTSASAAAYALTVIFSGGQMATNAMTAVALATTEERLIVRWLTIKKTGSV